MEFKIINELTKDEMSIREEVFMQEQSFKNEFDDIDDSATHIVLYDDGSPVGCCRVYPDEAVGGFIFGRLAVKKISWARYRKKNYGEGNRVSQLYWSFLYFLVSPSTSERILC